MADLVIIDDLTEEISKIRGVDMPKICIKVIILSYLMYCCNTFDIKYKNEDNKELRTNSGCLILCQKGTGKSRTLRALKEIFIKVDEERLGRYNRLKAEKIQKLVETVIPLSKEQQEQVNDFYKYSGKKCVETFEDTATAKVLCEVYAQAKTYDINNLLFVIDEAGDRLFKDAFSSSPSMAARETVNAINQLFDGYCGMGQSKAARDEGIGSQHDVGANFIFVSTAEFLKDVNVQKKYKNVFEGGLARRLLFVNCPPINKLETDRKRYFPDFERFKPIADEIFFSRKDLNKKAIPVSEELWQVLEKKGAGSNIIIDDEYLLLNFCVPLAIWTLENEIKPYHWEYMLNVYKEIKNLNMPTVKAESSQYDKICVFMRDYMEKNSTKKFLWL